MLLKCTISCVTRESVFLEVYERKYKAQDRQRCIINALFIGEPLDREKRVIVQSIYAFAFL